MSADADEEPGLTRLRAMPLTEAEAVLFTCCASKEWASAVAARLPACTSLGALLGVAEQAWWALSPDHWREALNAHPKIGDRTAAGSTEGREQSAMETAGPALREAIAEGNLAYEQRFAMTYVVRAAGRSPAEMLLILRERLENDPEAELRVASAQQVEITRVRLVALLDEAAGA
ncbi:MAG TPA: 2-oxo-4-hydroxy-4-carboxy-5-ureidoimidazoline decarboxylase [Frankiaceae bacterium]|nr:2-oxo-4-hydroxy-4-carboxy-5-ureidoimidazoline decarboxylase [Frankiaceae bacterium]